MIHGISLFVYDGPACRCANLEAVDGTPIIDVKPMLSEDIDTR